MDEVQLKALQNLLATTRNVPPQHRMEALQVASRTQYGLYQQEGDQHGMAIYEPLVLLTQQAESPEQLEALLQQAERG
jgi:hypothetical protein